MSIDRKTIDDLKNDLEEKHNDIERQLREIDEKIALVEKQEMESIKKLESIFNARIENFENTIKTLRSCLSEKDEYIFHLKKDWMI